MAKTRPRVYIDSCCFIDVAKGRAAMSLEGGRDRHLPFVESLLTAALNDEIEVWASTLVIAECLHVEKGGTSVPDGVRQLFIRLLEAGHPVKLQSVDIFVAEKARSLLWDHGIRCGGAADSIHVATAIELGCEEFLSTNAKRGPLNADAATKLSDAFGLRVIEAPQTQVLPPKYHLPLIDVPGTS